MNTRIVLLATVMALGFLALDGTATEDSLLTQDAAAYCMEIDGQCVNPCYAVSGVVYTATGKSPPWYCPA